MNKETTEAHICIWLATLGSQEANRIHFADIQRLAKSLYSEEYPTPKQINDAAIKAQEGYSRLGRRLK